MQVSGKKKKHQDTQVQHEKGWRVFFFVFRNTGCEEKALYSKSFLLRRETRRAAFQNLNAFVREGLLG